MNDMKATNTVDLNFGSMLVALKNGHQARRKGWNGKGIFIAINTTGIQYDNEIDITQPFIYMDTTGLQTDNPDAPKSRVPWLASQTDLLAEDWEIIF